jgi:hypothetical protein
MQRVRRGQTYSKSKSSEEIMLFKEQSETQDSRVHGESSKAENL